MNYKTGMLIFLTSYFALTIFYALWRIAPRVPYQLHVYRMGKLSPTYNHGSSRGYLLSLKAIALSDLTFNRLPPQYTGVLQLESGGLWWTSALLTDALRTCYESFHSASDLDALTRYYDRLADDSGKFRNPALLQTVDNAEHGFALLYLSLVTRNNKYDKMADRIYAFLEAHPRSQSGAIPYRADERNLMLVDTLGMICPFLSLYGTTHNRPEAIELSERQLLDFLSHGVDKETGLPFQGYISGSPGYVGMRGWNRGVGWYLYGLVGTIENLPSDRPSRKALLSALERAADFLKRNQRSDGGWSWSVVNPYYKTDSSGTSMIAYQVEKAIQQNFLDATYAPMLDNAYKYLRKVTTPNGFVLDASNQGQVQDFGHYSGVQGPATAFAGLYLRRSQR